MVRIDAEALRTRKGGAHLRLTAALETLGFSRVIADSEGARYRLPDGQFIYESPTTIECVEQQARAVALKVFPMASVLVSETECSGWWGLDPFTPRIVEPPAAQLHDAPAEPPKTAPKASRKRRVEREPA